MILYHGTRGNPESILEHGLKPHGLDSSKEETIDRVLSEFGLTRETVPEWVWKGELEYERRRGQGHSHLCLNTETAAGYSNMGGEPAYVIRRNVLRWLNQDKVDKLWEQDRRNGTHELNKFLNVLDREAKEATGKTRYVLTLDVDPNDPALEKDVFETIKNFEKAEKRGELEKGDLDEFLKNDTYEVRYYGVISPHKIIAIEEVEDEKPVFVNKGNVKLRATGYRKTQLLPVASQIQ
jgi:hypothetical protein